MTLYAKFISTTQIEYAPKNKGSILNYNLNTDKMLQDGYKPLIKAEIPQMDRRYTLVYKESSENIVQIINFLESEEEYQIRKNNEAIQLDINLYDSYIKDLDFKRIRAICEPEIKDETTGETWLD